MKEGITIPNLIQQLREIDKAVSNQGEGQFFRETIRAAILMLEQVPRTYFSAGSKINLIENHGLLDILSVYYNKSDMKNEKEKLFDSIACLAHFTGEIENNTVVLPAELMQPITQIQLIAKNLVPKDVLLQFKTKLQGAPVNQPDKGDDKKNIHVEEKFNLNAIKNELTRISTELENQLAEKKITTVDGVYPIEKIDSNLRSLAIAANELREADRLYANIDLTDFSAMSQLNKPVSNMFKAINSLAYLPEKTARDLFSNLRVIVLNMLNEAGKAEKLFGIKAAYQAELEGALNAIVGPEGYMEWKWTQLQEKIESANLMTMQLNDVVMIANRYRNSQITPTLQELDTMVTTMNQLHTVECVQYAVQIKKIFNKSIGLDVLEDEIAARENEKKMLEFKLLNANAKESQTAKNEIMKLERELKVRADIRSALLTKVASRAYSKPFSYDPKRSLLVSGLNKVKFDAIMNLPISHIRDRFNSNVNQLSQSNKELQTYDKWINKRVTAVSGIAGDKKTEAVNTLSNIKPDLHLSHLLSAPINTVVLKFDQELSDFIAKNLNAFDPPELFDKKDENGFYRIKESGEPIAINVLRLSANILHRIHLLEKGLAAVEAADSFGLRRMGSFLYDNAQFLQKNVDLLKEEIRLLELNLKNLQQFSQLPLDGSQQEFVTKLSSFVGPVLEYYNQAAADPLKSLQQIVSQAPQLVGGAAQELLLDQDIQQGLQKVLNQLQPILLKQHEMVPLLNKVKSLYQQLQDSKENPPLFTIMQTCQDIYNDLGKSTLLSVPEVKAIVTDLKSLSDSVLAKLPAKIIFKPLAMDPSVQLKPRAIIEELMRDKLTQYENELKINPNSQLVRAGLQADYDKFVLITYQIQHVHIKLGVKPDRETIAAINQFNSKITKLATMADIKLVRKKNKSADAKESPPQSPSPKRSSPTSTTHMLASINRAMGGSPRSSSGSPTNVSPTPAATRSQSAPDLTPSSSSKTKAQAADNKESQAGHVTTVSPRRV